MSVTNKMSVEFNSYQKLNLFNAIAHDDGYDYSIRPHKCSLITLTLYHCKTHNECRPKFHITGGNNKEAGAGSFEVAATAAP
jgi:hypothetical protein